MSKGPSPAIQDLARRLLAFEAARPGLAVAPVDAAVRVCETLRGSLVKLAGMAGFVSLFSRALALAKAQVPSLAGVTVRPDGTLAGMDQVERGPDSRMAGDGGAALAAQLLSLLVTFIGESLTLRLVHDAWPEVSLDRADVGTEEPS